jgi:hypothetical protein
MYTFRPVLLALPLISTLPPTSNPKSGSQKEEGKRITFESLVLAHKTITAHLLIYDETIADSQ